MAHHTMCCAELRCAELCRVNIYWSEVRKPQFRLCNNLVRFYQWFFAQPESPPKPNVSEVRVPFALSLSRMVRQAEGEQLLFSA